MPNWQPKNLCFDLGLLKMPSRTMSSLMGWFRYQNFWQGCCWETCCEWSVGNLFDLHKTVNDIYDANRCSDWKSFACKPLTHQLMFWKQIRTIFYQNCHPGNLKTNGPLGKLPPAGNLNHYIAIEISYWQVAWTPKSLTEPDIIMKSVGQFLIQMCHSYSKNNPWPSQYPLMQNRRLWHIADRHVSVAQRTVHRT